ncbi:MAG: MoaD/ThiS family protein [Candidatus Helarchaeota archaeon]
MMQVKFVFYSTLIEITKTREITIFVKENSSIKDAIVALKYGLGEDISLKLYDKSGDLNKFILMLLNGKKINEIEGIEIKIQDGDEIFLVPAIAGG